MRARELGVLFALALIWGASFLFIKIGVEEVSPATVVAGRLFCSVVVLGVIVAARRELVAGWQRYWQRGVITGVINIVIPFLLISWGETRIASGSASILNATTPLFTVLLAALWLPPTREPLTVRRVTGVVVGFLGVGVLVGPGAFASGTGPEALLGEAAVLVAAAAYGVGTLLSRGFAGSSRLVGPLATQAPALLLSIPVALLWSPPTHMPTIKAVAAIATLGAVGTGIAYLLYFWLIANVGPTRTSLVTYLLPCTALFWGALLLREQVGWNSIAGLALVLFGTLLTNGALIAGWRWMRSRRSVPAVAVAATDEP